MATNVAQLEQRLSRLEAEFHSWQKSAEAKDSRPWYEQILGTFDNDPGFDEMIRLGKEIRDADHGLPTPRRNSTKSAKSNVSRRPKKGRA